MSEYSPSIQQKRFIVDKDITDTAIDGIYESLTSAIKAANKFSQEQKFRKPEKQQRIKIKIASNLYEESTIHLTIPDLVVEPKEKGGEVTLQQELAPVIVVDVGEGNSVTIKNTKLLMKSDYASG